MPFARADSLLNYKDSAGRVVRYTPYYQEFWHMVCQQGSMSELKVGAEPKVLTLYPDDH